MPQLGLVEACAGEIVVAAMSLFREASTMARLWPTDAADLLRRLEQYWGRVSSGRGLGVS